MNALRWMAMATLSAGFALVSLEACSDDAGLPSGDDDASVSGSSSGGSSSSGAASGGSSSGSTSSGGSSSGVSSSSSAGSSGAPDGGGKCEGFDFGGPAVAFENHDIEAFAGGVITPGEYDVVRAEIGSSLSSSIRETISFDAAGRFQRIRQITVNAAGPITVRAGTYATADKSITFTAECQTKDGADVTPESLTTPYDVTIDDAGLPMFRYGAAGTRITVKQH